MSNRQAWEFGGIRIDTRQWPLVIMVMPERAVSDTAVHGALAHLELLMRQTPAGAKFYQVTDLSLMKDVAPASQRKYAADWWARTEPLAVGRRLGGAIVAASPALRGMLTAVFWLMKPVTPTTIVSTQAEGLLCGIRAIEHASPPLPEHLVSLRGRLTATEARRAAVRP